MKNDLTKNADRFTGFADIYDSARPAVPEFPVKIIEKYLGKMPDTVVDMGCGTGLSTLIWIGKCSKAIGVEPSDDMRREAEKKANETLSFIKAFSHETGLPDNSADAVVCSQSFHWMEPVSTLNEVNRILREGGVFATIDCDWPPVTTWQAEKAYMNIYKKVKEIEAEVPDINDTFVRYEKKHHLDNIKSSGHFRYCREILFSNTETCTAQRLIKLLLSQGSVQTVLKKHPDMIEKDIEAFKNDVCTIFGDKEFDIEFSYRMRIGIK